MKKTELEILEEVKFGFDIYSDHSTICLGYRNLCDKIKRLKANEPIDKTISVLKTDLDRQRDDYYNRDKLFERKAP